MRTAPRLRQALRRAVLTLDPDAVQARHAKAKAARKIVEYPVEGRHGPALRHHYSPDATAIYQRLDTIARMCRDDRTMDQRRADVFVDLLLGKACYDTPATAATVLVTVAATTLAGMDDKPGELAGYGPISAAMARELATGHLAAAAHRPSHRRPSRVRPHHLPATRRARRLRKSAGQDLPVPRMPQARQAMRHRPPHAIPQGPTHETNLGTLCRRHHRLKHTHGWTVVRDTDGTFRWRSPTGR